MGRAVLECHEPPLSCASMRNVSRVQLQCSPVLRSKHALTATSGSITREESIPRSCTGDMAIQM